MGFLHSIFIHIHNHIPKDIISKFHIAKSKNNITFVLCMKMHNILYEEAFCLSC